LKINQTHKKSIAVLGIKGLPSKGGGERVAEAIIYKALQEEFDVTVYGKKNYCENFSKPDNLKLVLINQLNGKHLSAISFGLLSALHALLFGKYNLIHLHYADFGFLVPLLRLRFKVIGTSHGAEYNRDKWNRFAKMCFRVFEALFVRYVNVCTSVSKPLAKYYGRQYGRVVAYIPNGIFTEEGIIQADASVLRNHGLKSEDYILFCAGRIIPSKGCDIFLKAVREVRLDVPIVVVGDRSGDLKYKNYLEDLATNRVTFIDFIASKQELFQLISHCRYFVFPSAYEAMSIMLLEVALLKKGIICSDIPENYEAVDQNALYFRSDDYHDLAKKIQYAFEHHEEMPLLGEKAYEWVCKHRNWATLTEEYMKLYRFFVEATD
jgi:glycosyltransferase involved in cell wall biosynthesis